MAIVLVLIIKLQDNPFDNDDIEWAQFESPIAKEPPVGFSVSGNPTSGGPKSETASKAQEGKGHVVVGSVYDPSGVSSLQGSNATPDDNAREQERREIAPAPNTATERGQASTQDYGYVDDADEEDNLLGVAGAVSGRNGYQQLNKRQATAVKVNAERGKDRALSLLQVLSVGMDEHQVESAGEMLMRQLGTRPYGNDPDAGLVSRQPLPPLGAVEMCNHLNFCDSFVLLCCLQ